MSYLDAKLTFKTEATMRIFKNDKDHVKNDTFYAENCPKSFGKA